MHFRQDVQTIRSRDDVLGEKFDRRFGNQKKRVLKKGYTNHNLGASKSRNLENKQKLKSYSSIDYPLGAMTYGADAAKEM